ncbi:porin family protein [Phenylobacterium koreense]|uniref:TonB-dependent receptor-like beta-barrel domain-containing protein n=1 Tax=Phenylobacterium koreense TaxID=266125 RepID=A0ABV2ENC2_9CAUL
MKTLGSPDLTNVQVSTASVGAIFTPFGQDRLRFSLDYSQIRKTDAVFTPTYQTIIDNEDNWRGRILRAPLTDADRALGYAAGRVVEFDARPQNGSELVIDTLDGQFTSSLPFGGGQLQLYGDATYFLRQSQKEPFHARIDQIAFLGRPLAWKGNMGADWTRGPVTLGANLQYYDSYRIYPPTASASAATQTIAYQGSERIPSQTYLDLRTSWRPPAGFAGAHRARIDFGVVNVLDKAPPRESSFALTQIYGTSGPPLPGYSRYGDPRRRRFVVTLSTTF